MSSTNTCHFFGRLVAVPTPSYYTSNAILTQFSLAIDNFSLKADLIRKGRGNEYSPTFVDCKLWGASGENLAKYSSQGQQIYVQAEAIQERWKDQTTGTNRSRITYRVISWQLGRETEAVLKAKYGTPQSQPQAQVPPAQGKRQSRKLEGKPPVQIPQSQPQPEMAGVGDMPY